MCHVMTRSHTWVYRPISAVGPASPDICLEPSKSHHFTTVHQTQHSLSLLWRSHSFELLEYSTTTLSSILSYYLVIWTQKGKRLLNSWMCIHPAAILYICARKYTCLPVQLESQGRAEEGRGCNRCQMENNDLRLKFTLRHMDSTLRSSIMIPKYEISAIGNIWRRNLRILH